MPGRRCLKSRPVRVRKVRLRVPHRAQIGAGLDTNCCSTQLQHQASYVQNAHYFPMIGLNAQATPRRKVNHRSLRARPDMVESEGDVGDAPHTLVLPFREEGAPEVGRWAWQDFQEEGSETGRRA